MERKARINLMAVGEVPLEPTTCNKTRTMRLLPTLDVDVLIKDALAPVCQFQVDKSRTTRQRRRSIRHSTD